MSITYCPCGHEEDNDQHACPVTHKRLCGNLSLAEEGLANYAQENALLKALLKRIQQARLTWAMACPHDDCGACVDFDEELRASLPQSREHET